MKEGKIVELQKEIFQYVRDSKGKIIGLMLARKIGQDIYIGTSIAAVARGDVFDLDLAYQIADSRILNSQMGLNQLPVHSQYRQDLVKLIGRSIKYFNNDKIVAPPVCTGEFHRGTQLVDYNDWYLNEIES